MKPCCLENLGAPQTPNQEKPELTVRVCGVCGARHFELDADRLELDLIGERLS